MCVHNVNQWTGNLSSVCSHLKPSVPGIGSGFTVIVTENEQMWINVCKMFVYSNMFFFIIIKLHLHYFKPFYTNIMST